MNPIFFGDGQAPLFGVEHPPRGRSVSGRGIVLCAPIGQEYMRSHRAFRSLANRLARAGHHVFRFDYFGTGDSAGDSDAGTPEIWRRNVVAAIEELRESAALDSVSLVGLRWGAALAMRGARGRDDIDQIVLWDPVLRGRDYLAEMDEWAQATSREDGTVGVLGFPLTPQMRAEIDELDREEWEQLRARRVRSVVSSEDSAVEAMIESLARAGVDARHAVVPAGGRWNEVDNFGGALVPQEIIQYIVGEFQAGESPRRQAGGSA